MPGVDPVRPHEVRAIRALLAQARFQREKSPDMPDLPLNMRRKTTLACFKWLSDSALFGRGLYTTPCAAETSGLEGHPDFETFAAWASWRSRVDARAMSETMPELLRRYPPKPLQGLGSGLWCSNVVKRRTAADGTSQDAGRSTFFRHRCASPSPLIFKVLVGMSTETNRIAKRMNNGVTHVVLISLAGVQKKRLRPRRIPGSCALKGFSGKKWDDGIERISTQTVFDILEVPHRSRTAGACRRLAKADA